ncbi:bromodomain-containing protein 4B [Biomphalaria pfeifferi]|uniref:Bromodomain-containing protein 4B n=1 Tax=Biomphalaria pfeifferi TaxID=112525 RepID=A0AAD8B9Q2_BIOPF|nr:bromodomain-containing protein 4B [Biomphalaria pfeifferi]
MLFVQLKKWFIAQKRKPKKILDPVTVKTGLSRSSESVTMTTKRVATSFVKECGYIPIVLISGASIIEKNLKTKDLFQIQGSAAKINFTISQLGISKVSRMKNLSVHDVVEAMKSYLVRLPEPLLPEDVCDALIKASTDDYSSRYKAILSDFRQSQAFSFGILHFMMLLFQKVASYSEHNSMDVRKLATIFVLDVINPLKIDDPGHGSLLQDKMQRLPYLIMIVEYMINNVHIFNSICQLKGPVSPCRGSSSIRVQSTPPRRTRSKMCTGLEKGTTSFPNQTLSTVEKDQGDCLTESQLRTDGGTGKKSLTLGCLYQSEDLSLQRKTSSKKQEVTCGDASPQYLVCVKSKVDADVGTSPMEATPAFTWRTKPSPRKMSAKNNKRFTSPSPKVRRTSINKGDGNADAKLMRSTDKKAFCKLRAASGGPEEMRKKRKSRPIQRVEQAAKIKGRSRSQDSAYAVFQADEEMCPWNDLGIISDDTSVMTKTIKYPRIMPLATERSKSKQTKPSKQQHWRCKYVNSDNLMMLETAADKIKRPSPLSVVYEPSVAYEPSVVSSPSRADRCISLSHSVKITKDRAETHKIEYYSLLQADVEPQAPGNTVPPNQISARIIRAGIAAYKSVSSRAVSQDVKDDAAFSDVKITTAALTQCDQSLKAIQEKAPAVTLKVKPVQNHRKVSSDLRQRQGNVRTPYQTREFLQEKRFFGSRAIDVILLCVTVLFTCVLFYYQLTNKLFQL